MENEQKHTPGPWAVRTEPFRRDGQLFTLIHAENEGWLDQDTPQTAQIACVPHRRDDNSLPESRLANARLIAAAPKLLMASKLLVAVTDGVRAPYTKRNLQSAINLARKAIAKATH